MLKINLFLVLLILFMSGFSQQIHSPAEILKIMSDSKLSFEIKPLDKAIPCKDYSNELNYHDSYRVSSDSILSTYKFSFNKEAKPLYEKAEGFFQSHNSDSAMVYYQLAIKADSSLSNVMTYVGQIYEHKGNREKAIEWYKKAISKNYIDYMAHWFLADNYLAVNNVKDAVDEIIIAQILNRNNERIKKSFVNIFKNAFLNTEDWCFNPQMELSRISDSKISISINEKWTGYAMAKALWSFEPGYRESMGVTKGKYTTIEDQECLIAEIIGLENAKIEIGNDRQLVILKQTAGKKFLDAYILYEILLPQFPYTAYQLPKKTILNIKDYILEIRNKD